MKNLLYILIFLPNLLFSQETKNMEFVGVRSETVVCNSIDVSTMNFTVDSGYLFKITNSRFTHSSLNITLSINDEVINARHKIYTGNSNLFIPPNFSYPIFLGEGDYELKLYLGSTNSGSATISGLEFKLTTP